jgi:hypothetical protein
MRREALYRRVRGMDTRQNGTSWQEKEEFEKNTCESPCGENARTYWKVQGKKGKVITVKRKVVVCALAAATPTPGMLKTCPHNAVPSLVCYRDTYEYIDVTGLGKPCKWPGRGIPMYQNNTST